MGVASSESRLAVSVKTEKCLFTSDCILEMYTEMCTVQFVAAALFLIIKAWKHVH